MPIVTVMVAMAAVVPRPPSAEAGFDPPKLEGHVIDTSDLVDDHVRFRIGRDLAAFRESTGFAIVVFVTGSLAGTSIEDVAYATFRAWKIGDAGKDNGVLLLIAPEERKVRIETGKGVGGAITDLESNDIIAEIEPYLQVRDLQSAIVLGTTEIKKRLGKEIGKVVADPNAVVAPAGGDLIDETHALTDSVRADLQRELELFRKTTRRPIGMLVTGPLMEPIAKVAASRFKHWQLGARNNYDAVLLVASPADRAFFVQVGYGGARDLGEARTQAMRAKLAAARERYDLVELVHVACGQLAQLLPRLKLELPPPPPITAEQRRTRTIVIYAIFGVIGGGLLLIGILAIVSRRFRSFGTRSLDVFFVALRAVGWLIGAGRRRKEYEGGGGKSGGGGSSGDY
jgi:uncharacterized membrane protein YgcG